MEKRREGEQVKYEEVIQSSEWLLAVKSESVIRLESVIQSLIFTEHGVSLSPLITR